MAGTTMIILLLVSSHFCAAFLQEACKIEWVPWLLKVPKGIKHYIFLGKSQVVSHLAGLRNHQKCLKRGNYPPRLSRLCQTLGVILSKLGQTRFMLPTALYEFTTYPGLR